ncbi:hypothetical protein BDB01DRAFT_727373 [Pilobolus umbonatus]|nr:hypothetical protein BDB01DRAFT_727373 [Pilobolus umbonatus]
MPPKKKVKLLKLPPEEAKWCLDRSNRLSFKDEIVDIVTEQRLKSLRATAANKGVSGRDSSALHVSDNSSALHVSDDSSALQVSDDSSTANELTSVTDTMLLEVRDHLISVMTNVVNEEDKDDDPWMFKGINMSHLFRKYQATISEILVKHKTLPVESYVHELASLTHILFLCKDQHSEVAEKVFSLETLQQLTASLETEIISHNREFPTDHFMTITNTLTDLSLSIKTREEAIMEFTVLAFQMDYGQKRLLYGIINLESELWSTYFDPLLSCIISDPDRLIHLRWTNTIPLEKGKSRPDAVISEKRQLTFGSNVGYGEAKREQGFCRKSLCLDTLRLAIFTKNAIDINKLDGALAFQIHAFNITFYLQQLNAKGIYTFVEIAHFRFPQSLDDLPSLFTLVNIRKLLGVSDVFWSRCTMSKRPEVIDERYRKTLVSIESMIDTAQDSTRQCVLRYGH